MTPEMSWVYGVEEGVGGLEAPIRGEEDEKELEEEERKDGKE